MREEWFILGCFECCCFCVECCLWDGVCEWVGGCCFGVSFWIVDIYWWCFVNGVGGILVFRFFFMLFFCMVGGYFGLECCGLCEGYFGVVMYW